MEYKKLANTGLTVSKIAVGTWQFGHAKAWGELSEEKEYQQIVDRAISAGINFFDTAKAYGQSEEILGKALKGKRDKVILATKLGGRKYDYDTVRSGLEGSLKRLQTDYIDLYQIHWPKIAHRDGSDMEQSDYENIFDSMSRLTQEGLIRFAGVSNFRLPHLKAFSNEARDFLATDQVPYSLLWRFYDMEGVSEFCRQNNISLLAYSPLGQGLLSGRFGRQGEQVLERTRRKNLLFNEPLCNRALPVVAAVKDVAGEMGVTPSQVALKWAMEKDVVASVLSGVRKLSHLNENIEAVDVPLTEEQLWRLDKVSLDFQKSMPAGLEMWLTDNRKEDLEKLGIREISLE